MKVGVDCRLAGLEHAGIGRYTQHLLREAIPSAVDTEWVLFFYSQQQAGEVLGELIESENVKVVIVEVSHYSLSEQLRMPGFFYAENLDVLHVPHFNVPLLYFRKTVVTIHDLLWHTHTGTEVTTLPKWQYWIKYLFYRVVTWWAVQFAAAVIVPTQTVAGSVASFYPQAADKLVVTYEGVECAQTEISDAQRSGNNLLYVGSLYPHKNLEIVLQALTELPEFGLTVVSARSVFTEQVMLRAQQLGLHDRVTFVGRVSDQQLAELYAESCALIQPSLSEGFGLTGIEALCAGTPLLASDIPTFHEVYEDGAIYFDPHDVASVRAAIKQVGSVTLEQRKTVADRVRAKFQWSTMAKQTLNVYKSV